MDTEMYSPIMPSYNTMELDELPFWSAAFGIELLNKIGYKPNLRVLDIGCGTGFPLLEVAMRLGKAALVYGLDPNAAALKRAEEKATLYGIANLHLLETVAESIPLPNESIDLIISNNGLNNVTNLLEVLNECKRVLSPNGRLLFTYNTHKTMHVFYEVFEAVLLEKHLNACALAMHDHILKKRPAEETMQSLLESMGFRINYIEQHVFTYQFASGTAFFNHGFIRSAFYPSWLELVPAEKAEDIFSCIEHRLNQKAALDNGLTMPIPFVVIDCQHMG
jgi:ubiquinone/menaquinone biosynthesis C-methylase UbiE